MCGGQAAASRRHRAVILRPVSFDDDADDDADDAASLFGPPPHPDDRLWRHPSEMADCPGRRAASSFVGGGTGGRTGHRPIIAWPWGMIAGAVGAVGALVAGLAVGVASVGDGPGPVATPRRSSTPTFGEETATDDATLALARDTVAPSVVALDLAQPGATAPPVTAGTGAPSRPSSVDASTAYEEGSGVIVRPEGIVVTSADLVETGPVAVRLNDGRNVSGQVMGSDPVTGLAVLDLDGDGYHAATPAGAVPARGSRVVTVAAGRDGPAATGGVVGAPQRLTGEGAVPMEGVMAVDGPTTYDDVGAATVDHDGDLLGVTTVVRDEGTCFTVPLDVVDKVTDDVLADGQAHHSLLGIDGLDSASDGERARGLLGGPDQGIVVSSVTPDGPSALAGLRRADVILAIDGHEVATMPDLVRWLRARSPGETAVLSVERGGTTSEVPVTLGAAAPA
jgi:serine protease Do